MPFVPWDQLPQMQRTIILSATTALLRSHTGRQPRLAHQLLTAIEELLTQWHLQDNIPDIRDTLKQSTLPNPEDEES